MFAPDPEQLEQLESHDWQEDVAVSKNCDCEHVGRQRPLLRTGRSEEQLEHWLNKVPEQVAQSGWQARHVPEELIVPEGQEDTQVPLDASWLFEHDRQKSADPAHVLQDESQAVICLVSKSLA